MQIANTKNCKSFGAKFANTETLHRVVDYAISKNKFDKLNNARKNIEKTDCFTKVAVELVEDAKAGKTTFLFTTYKPRYTNKSGQIEISYNISKYERPATKTNVIKELFEYLVKMGNNAPENKIYKHIVKDE